MSRSQRIASRVTVPEWPTMTRRFSARGGAWKAALTALVAGPVADDQVAALDGDRDPVAVEGQDSFTEVVAGILRLVSHRRLL